MVVKMFYRKHVVIYIFIHPDFFHNHMTVTSSSDHDGQAKAAGGDDDDDGGRHPPPTPGFLPLISVKSISLTGRQKKHYRQRAHANPFSDHSLQYPIAPSAIDWSVHYPAFSGTGKAPEFADVGCGFGGLLIALAPMFPDTLMLGISPPFAL